MESRIPDGITSTMPIDTTYQTEVFNTNLSTPVLSKEELYKLKLCDCARYGEVVKAHENNLGIFPQLQTALLLNNMQKMSDLGYRSPYCDLPTLEQERQRAIDEAGAYNCKGFWSASRCDNYRNELRAELIARYTAEHKTRCMDKVPEEQAMVQALMQNAKNAIAGKIGEDEYSPEKTAEEEAKRKKMTMQMAVLGVFLAIGVGVIPWRMAS